ncbi:MAG: right-handed parallel beta-helix repeat-containing protein [Candidatus Bathyarchaeia archaeon]
MDTHKKVAAIFLALMLLYSSVYVIGSNLSLAGEAGPWQVYYEGIDESAYRFNLEKRVSGLEIWLYVSDERVGWDKDWIKIVLAGYPLTVHTPEGDITVKPILGVAKIGYENDVERNAGGLHVAYYILPKESEVYYVNVTIYVPRGSPRLDISRSIIKAWKPEGGEAPLQTQVYRSEGCFKYDVIDRRGRAALASFGIPSENKPPHSLLDFAFGKTFKPPTDFAWKPDVYVEYACVGGINIAPESFVGVGNYSCLINVGIGGGTFLNSAVNFGLGQTVYKVRAGEGSLPPYAEEAVSGSIDILLEVMQEACELFEYDVLGTVLSEIGEVLWVYELAQIVGSVGFNEIASMNRVLVFKNFDIKDGLCVWLRFFAEVASAGFAGGIVNFWGDFPFGSSIFDEWGYSVTELKDENGNTIEGGVWIGGILIDYHDPEFRGEGPAKIRPDGAVEPFTAPIWTFDYVNYKLLDNISFGIEIERENAVLDGCNHTINLISPRIGGTAVAVAAASNVVVKNLNIINCAVGIVLDNASSCTITLNQITDAHEGIYLTWSSGNVISNNHIRNADVTGVELRDSEQNIIMENEFAGCNMAISMRGLSLKNCVLKNNITNCGVGIDVPSPSNDNYLAENNIACCSECGISLGAAGNKVIGNKITCGTTINTRGIHLRRYSSSNNVSKNYVSGFSMAIHLEETSNNVVSFNNIIFNTHGFYFTMQGWPSENNTIFGNNMMNNTYDCFFSPNSAWKTLIYNNNFLDGGAEKIYGAWSAPVTWNSSYPYGGNYWGKYDGKDEKCGSDQNIGGSDGIGDTPYSIDEQNIDYYPLMEPFGELLPLVYCHRQENISIQLISNSVVSNFVCDLRDKRISFEVYWRNGTMGFAIIDVPKNVFKGEPEVYFDGKPAPFNKSEVYGLTRIHLFYQHSKHHVEMHFRVDEGTPSPPPSPTPYPTPTPPPSTPSPLTSPETEGSAQTLALAIAVPIIIFCIAVILYRRMKVKKF